MQEDIIPPAVLGETLTDFGLLNEEQLRLAQERSRLEDTTLRDAVLWFNFLSDEELGKVVADYFRVPYVNLFQKEITDETLRMIPEVVAKSQRVIVFSQDADGLHVALADPRNIEILEFLKRKTGLSIIKYYATERDVTEALHRYKKGVTQAFDDILRESIEEAKGSVSKETDPPIIRIVDALIQYAYQNKASDIHQEPRDHDALVRFRIDGALHDIVKIPLELHPQIVSRIKILSSLRTDEHQTPQDGKLQVIVDTDQVDIRVSIIPITNGEKLVLRLLSERSRQFSLGNLGLDGVSLEKVQAAYHKPYGMILVTGPTGSGKTTTLYSILKLLNHRDVNIVTIEDPVEYDVEGVNQIQVNSDANLTFATGLRSILRQDPNIILVGEIRDDETAGIATNLSMTGHLVLSTLHTNNAATTIPRLIDMHIEPFLIASTVNVVVAQRLVRKIHQVCRVSEEIPIADVAKSVGVETIEKKFGKDIRATLRLYRGKGCEACHGTGYQGRIGLFEVMVFNDTLRDAITRQENSSVIEALAQENGMQTMLEDGLSKMQQGLTTLEEVIRVSKE